MSGQRVLAPAKVNLSLQVLAREDSGYHQIETLFCALDLADELDVSIGEPGLRLEVLAPPESAEPPPDLGPAPSNLAWRAATSFFEATGMPPASTIRLTKRIPAGAGLGGGSSDAAAVLTALNTLHDRPLDSRRLLEVGAGLGSDVPFFVGRCALALAWGRGGRLLALPPLPPRPVLLLVPPTGVSTPAAYARLAATRDHSRPAPPALIPGPPTSWDEVADMATNDFERVVFDALPLLRELRDLLADTAARPAMLTGTGSVVFGVFRDVQAAGDAADRVAGRHPNVRCILTSTASAVGTA